MSYLIITLIAFLFAGPVWSATYSVSPILHSITVEERLRETQGSPPEGRVLFGEVIIRNNSADIAWVAVAQDILVLGLNRQIGIEGPGAVGRVFGLTDRTGLLRLIEFGDQGLVVSEAGVINAIWHCPNVTAINRACQASDPGTTAQRELDRLLAFADRGKSYDEFDGFEFGGRVIDREHLLPTQVNRFGQVVFIHPPGQSPNAIFLATPLSVAGAGGSPLLSRLAFNGRRHLLLLAIGLGGLPAWLWRRRRR